MILHVYLVLFHRLRNVYFSYDFVSIIINYGIFLMYKLESLELGDQRYLLQNGCESIFMYISSEKDYNLSTEKENPVPLPIQARGSWKYPKIA